MPFWSRKPKKPTFNEAQDAYNASVDAYTGYLVQMTRGMGAGEQSWFEAPAVEELVRLLTICNTKMDMVITVELAGVRGRLRGVTTD
ncbi:MAG TPA: hypothetical protein QGF58_00500 [Myxococcota bacterium]|nr:hypothetical protein [Myxococcota bacterium]